MKKISLDPQVIGGANYTMIFDITRETDDNELKLFAELACHGAPELSQHQLSEHFTQAHARCDQHTEHVLAGIDMHDGKAELFQLAIHSSLSK